MRESAQSHTSGAHRPDPVLMTQEQAETRELATLLEVGQALAGAHELKSALGRVLETLARRHGMIRSEEHTSELQSRQYLVCRLLLEKKKKKKKKTSEII